MNPWKDRREIGDAVLYLGDCLDILPTLGPVDAVVTDPPYGIKRDKGFGGFVGFGGLGPPIARTKYEGDWDKARPSQETFDAVVAAAPLCLIWGGQFFADLLPPGGHWIVWDKLNTMPTFGDCELAWTNSPRKSVKKWTIEYNGLIGKEKHREHATQKPLALMDRCISQYTQGGEVVADPFMGSGTTGVACANLGRKFIGIEIEPKYYEIACERIDAAYAQGRLF